MISFQWVTEGMITHGTICKVLSSRIIGMGYQMEHVSSDDKVTSKTMATS